MKLEETYQVVIAKRSVQYLIYVLVRCKVVSDNMTLDILLRYMTLDVDPHKSGY